MASKKVEAVNLRGELNVDTMEIVEVTKETEFTYDFLEILRDFDSKQVTISIKLEKELPVKDEE